MRCARGFLAVLTLLVLQPAAAYAGTIPIEIVSQWYSTSGCEDSRDMPGSCFDVGGAGSVYSPSGRNWAIGRLHGTELVLEANVSMGSYTALSEVSMVFRPAASGLADVFVHLLSTGGYGPRVKLQDTSTGEWLLDFSDVPTLCGPHVTFECTRSLPLSFTAGHDYALTLVADNPYYDSYKAGVTMPFAVVPDPGSTLLLLGLGLAGLAWRRRRD